MNLTDFLLARIAEDEQRAKAAGGESWSTDHIPGPTMRKSDDQPTEVIIDSPSSLIAGFVAQDVFADHIVRHDPLTVLAECEAKRQVVFDASDALRAEEARPETGDEARDEAILAGANIYERVLSALALPYADHPDYDPSWRP